MKKTIPTIEELYEFYLNKINLPESAMGESQRKVMKTTFYAAVSQILILMRDDIGELSEGEGVEAMESLWEQCNTFFMDLIPKN